VNAQRFDPYKNFKFLAHAGHVAAVQFDAELEILVRIETLCVDGELSHTFSSENVRQAASLSSLPAVAHRENHDKLAACRTARAALSWFQGVRVRPERFLPGLSDLDLAGHLLQFDDHKLGGLERREP